MKKKDLRNEIIDTLCLYIVNEKPKYLIRALKLYEGYVFYGGKMTLDKLYDTAFKIPFKEKNS